MAGGAILVYGGAGALGAALVDTFKTAGFETVSIDLFSNEAATHNIVLPKSMDRAKEQAEFVKDNLEKHAPFDAILCVAGGWAGGNATTYGI